MVPIRVEAILPRYQRSSLEAMQQTESAGCGTGFIKKRGETFSSITDAPVWLVCKITACYMPVFPATKEAALCNYLMHRFKLRTLNVPP